MTKNILRKGYAGVTAWLMSAVALTMLLASSLMVQAQSINITNLLTDATSTWTAGKGLILIIVGFTVGLSVFWMAFKRAKGRS